MCLAGASITEPGPGALLRGGGSFGGAINGPLTVFGTFVPTDSQDFIGFRCARPLPEPGCYAQWLSGATALAALARARRRDEEERC
jgi:hypothetical protein